MKKLMIALAAAAAITGVAKAETGPGVGYTTTFENLNVGASFNADTNDTDTAGTSYWAIEADPTESYAIVTNSNFNGTAPEALGDKSLTIDTDKLLSRKVNPDNIHGAAVPESFETVPLYFDGYVQFTAADSVPDLTDGDKLVVWLYGADEETAPYGIGTNLVITAATVDGQGNPSPTNFFVTTEMDIQPNSWHRLSIKAFKDGYYPMFAVYVDGTKISAATPGLDNGRSEFNSLVAWNSQTEEPYALTSVSFKGTGAVDELGFTNNDLFPEAAAETFTLTVTAEGGSAVVFADEFIETKPSPYTYDLNATTIYATFAPTTEGATVTATLNGTTVNPDGDPEDGVYYYIINVPEGVEAGATLTLAFSATGGEPPVGTVNVTVTGGANATAAWTVNGESVAAPSTLNVSDTYSVTFTANEGFAFDLGATTHFEGTATAGEDIVIVAPNATATLPQNWPTGEDLDELANQTVATAYPALAESALANVDAKVFATWAAGNGGVAFADKATTTYNVDCFLLNIANASTTEQIAAAKETAAEAIKITAITFDEDGKPVLTAPATYGNGKVVIKGSATLPVESWHDQIDGDHFFRSELVVDAVPEN